MICECHSTFGFINTSRIFEKRLLHSHSLHIKKNNFLSNPHLFTSDFVQKYPFISHSNFNLNVSQTKSNWKVLSNASDPENETVKKTPVKRGRKKKSEISSAENTPVENSSEASNPKFKVKSSPNNSSETSNEISSETDQIKSTSENPKSSKKSKIELEKLAESKIAHSVSANEPSKKPPRPIVLCIGEIIYEFVPSVRVSPIQQEHTIISTWKGLQWTPPDFALAPSGTAMNMAISLARYNVRTAMIGRIGRDNHGRDMVMLMKQNGVKTRHIVFVDTFRSCATSVVLEHDQKGKLAMLPTVPSADMSLSEEDMDPELIRKAVLLHFSALSLLNVTTRAAIAKAIEIAQKSNTLIFFDPNLPLPLWQSREFALTSISDFWINSDIIEVTKQEIEFLLDEEYYERRRKSGVRFVSQSIEQLKKKRDEYHYLPEEIEFLWHDKLKLLLVTDGTWRVHYYTCDFHGSVAGTEDVLVSAFTCDRSGSGDTIVAGIIRRVVSDPEVLKDQVKLEKAIRFGIAGGIISQWTVGAIRGFPTESAAQNMVETVFPIAMV